MSRGSSFKYGNDTIDCYPLGTEEIKKILVVSKEKFKEIEKNFQAFFKGLDGRLNKRSSLLGANKRQILKPQRASEGITAKFDSEEFTRNFLNYAPTNAIYCNTSDRRRWIRVQEWFAQYGQEVEKQKFPKEILIQ